VVTVGWHCIWIQFGGWFAQGCWQRGRLCQWYFMMGIFSIFFLLLCSFWCYYSHNQQQGRFDLMHFQRSTRDPHCILSCLTAHLRCGRERENCVRREGYWWWFGWWVSHEKKMDNRDQQTLFGT
jgi:hypothetical protein